jgi:hypothetical protein
MSKGILASWFASVAAVLSRPFQTDAIALAPAASPAPQLLMPAAMAPRAALPRPLAAQLASHAKLNVRAGRKPRVAPIAAGVRAKAKPVQPAKAAKAVKTSKNQPRSVFLQARHVAARAAVRPTAAIIPMPVRAKTTRPHARPGTGRVVRFAA